MEEVPTIDDINNVVMTTRNNITLSALQALTGSHEIPILNLKLVSSSLNSKFPTDYWWVLHICSVKNKKNIDGLNLASATDFSSTTFSHISIGEFCLR